MTNRTCKGCPDRHEACHDHCERYKKRFFGLNGGADR